MHTLLITNDAGATAVSVLTIAVPLLALLTYVVLFVAALISILCSGHSGGMKLAWLIFAFIAPFIGSALWFLVGRRDANRPTYAPR